MCFYDLWGKYNTSEQGSKITSALASHLWSSYWWCKPATGRHRDFFATLEKGGHIYINWILILCLKMYQSTGNKWKLHVVTVSCKLKRHLETKLFSQQRYIHGRLKFGNPCCHHQVIFPYCPVLQIQAYGRMTLRLKVASYWFFLLAMRQKHWNRASLLQHVPTTAADVTFSKAFSWAALSSDLMVGTKVHSSICLCLESRSRRESRDNNVNVNGFFTCWPTVLLANCPSAGEEEMKRSGMKRVDRNWGDRVEGGGGWGSRDII